jgi:methylated-DNA-[protein]-cysteine S-methyltransferase
MNQAAERVCTVRVKMIPSTPFGPVAILWSPWKGKEKVSSVLLSAPGQSAAERVSRLFPHVEHSSCPKIERVAGGIEAFLNGRPVEFPLDTIRLDACSSFQQAVLRAEFGIPRGSVSTYQFIAAHLGRTRGARAVGNALAKNPFPIIIPCHRAICSDRSLGGYQGGSAMKRALLKNEGIHFDDRGRVLIRRFHYEKKLAR